MTFEQKYYGSYGLKRTAPSPVHSYTAGRKPGPISVKSWSF